MCGRQTNRRCDQQEVWLNNHDSMANFRVMSCLFIAIIIRLMATSTWGSCSLYPNILIEVNREVHFTLSKLNGMLHRQQTINYIIWLLLSKHLDQIAATNFKWTTFDQLDVLDLLLPSLSIMWSRSFTFQLVTLKRWEWAWGRSYTNPTIYIIFTVVTLIRVHTVYNNSN